MQNSLGLFNVEIEDSSQPDLRKRGKNNLGDINYKFYTEEFDETIKAEDGDLIYIREFPYRQAKISGAVLKPGSYTMAAGETINDLIQKAGGYTDNAYKFGAIYLNEDAKLINEQSKEILYQEFLDNIIAVSQQNIGGNFDLAPIVKLTDEIKSTAPNGRVVIDLLNDGSIDLYNIKEGDELFIPERNNVVYVYGETSTEGAVMYSELQDVEYFVEKSGGYKQFADNSSIYILHPNGESQLYNSKRSIFERSPTDRCALALRDFTDAKSEKQLLFAIQTLASFNSAGITKQKLIQHAQWKMASKYDVWTRDVATLFGNCLSLKLENESKEDGGGDTRGRSVSVGIILENENENVNETDYDGDDNTQQQEEEEVQEQTIRQPTIFNVTAPPGTRAGQVIRVSTPRGIVQVAIPPGITAGMTFQMAVN
mgnify:CR=1 FL=1